MGEGFEPPVGLTLRRFSEPVFPVCRTGGPDPSSRCSAPQWASKWSIRPISRSRLEVGSRAESGPCCGNTVATREVLRGSEDAPRGADLRQRSGREERRQSGRTPDGREGRTHVAALPRDGAGLHASVVAPTLTRRNHEASHKFSPCCAAARPARRMLAEGIGDTDAVEELSRWCRTMPMARRLSRIRSVPTEKRSGPERDQTPLRLQRPGRCVVLRRGARQGDVERQSTATEDRRRDEWRAHWIAAPRHPGQDRWRLAANDGSFLVRSRRLCASWRRRSGSRRMTSRGRPIVQHRGAQALHQLC